MQVQKLEEGVKDLTTRLFSPDPILFNSAINAYLEPNARYTSFLVQLGGCSHLKRWMYVKKRLLERERKIDDERVKRLAAGKGEGVEVVGGALWDESAQTLTVPTLTTYGLPFVILIDFVFTFPTTLTLTVNTNEESELEDEDGSPDTDADADVDVGTADAGLYTDDEDAAGEVRVEGEKNRRYWVTKLEERGPWDSMLEHGFLHKIHQSLLRPLTTFFLLTFSSILLFMHNHPLSNGLGPFLTSAGASAWNEVQGEVSRRFTRRSGGAGRVTRGQVGDIGKQGQAFQQGKGNHQGTDTPKSSTSGPSTPRKSPSGKGFQPSSPRATISSSPTLAQAEPHSGSSETTTTTTTPGGASATSYAAAVMEEATSPPTLGEEYDHGKSVQTGQEEGTTSYAEVTAEGPDSLHLDH